MHEVKRVVSTGLRDIHNWKRLRAKCLFKSNKRSLNQTLFRSDFQQYGNINEETFRNCNQI